MLPSFIILGAQKSATSLVQRCIGEHPEVFMPGDETRFFQDPWFGTGDPASLEAEIAAPPDGRVVGIKRADYLARPECPARIHALLPRARLLATLRNPVDRAVSAYFWYMLCGFLPLLPLEEGLARILDDPAFAERFPMARDILEYGLYGTQLSRYFERFTPEQTLVLTHEDIRRDPAGVIRTCYAFIGVDPLYPPKSLHSRPKQSVYSLARLRFLRARPLHRFTLAYCAFHPLPRSGAQCLENARWLIKAGVLGTDRLLLARLFRNPRPRLSHALRDRLIAYYREDLGRLEALLDRDFSPWKRSGPDRANST